MKRRKFIRNTLWATAGLTLSGGAISNYTYHMQSALPPSIAHISLSHFGQELDIYGIQTGSVKVKRSHRNASMGIPQIMIDPFWTPWLPIWTWVIRHPEGIVLVDTGENVRVNDKDYFACDPINGWVNKSILGFQVEKEAEIQYQLNLLNIQPKDIRFLVLTHLHIDHVDGLQYFPDSQIFLSRSEHERPFGNVPCLLPSWFKPELITHSTGKLPHFSGAFPLTKQEDLWMVPTPGHTYGHQSLLLRGEKTDVLFAGDVAFSQQQLLAGKVAGINVDKKASRHSHKQIKAYAQERPLVFLPSHDPESGMRLQNLQALFLDRHSTG